MQGNVSLPRFPELVSQILVPALLSLRQDTLQKKWSGISGEVTKATHMTEKQVELKQQHSIGGCVVEVDGSQLCPTGLLIAIVTVWKSELPVAGYSLVPLSCI